MKKNHIILAVLVWINTCYFSQTIPSYLPKDSLKGYWPFDSNANDKSGNQFHGDTINVKSTQDRFGKENNAYEFNGKNSRIEINHALFNIGQPNYSISLWLNTSSLSNSNNYNDAQTLLNTDDHNGIGIAIHGGKNPFGSEYTNKFSLGIGSTPELRNWDIIGKKENATNYEVKTNEWIHYVLVKKDTFQYNIYLNGEFDRTLVGEIKSNDITTKLVFGALAKKIATSESEESFLGKLDDFAIWNRALSPKEVRNIYSETASLTNLKKEDFTIFPNPTNGNFTLKCISDGLKKYTITDINAKMIVEEKIIGYETPVDAIGILNPGIYFFNIKDEQSHSIYTEKIIIQ